MDGRSGVSTAVGPLARTRTGDAAIMDDRTMNPGMPVLVLQIDTPSARDDIR
jgi:hypothetical protein